MSAKIVYKDKFPVGFEDEKYVKEIIEYFAEDLEDCKVFIRFRNTLDLNKFEVADCYVRNLSVKKHEIIITNGVLFSISKDGGAFFCISIFHEFEHIKDYIHMMEKGKLNFNLCISKQKNFERQYISSGFTFWTEVFAYYNSILFAKENELTFEKITYSNLVKVYKRTISLFKKYDKKKDLTMDEAEDYVEAVNSFVYLCAKFLASAYCDHSKIPHKKIAEDKDYQKVYAILYGMSKKVIRIAKKPYCEKSQYNLFKLGEFLNEKVRWDVFEVGLTKHKGKIHSFF